MESVDLKFKKLAEALGESLENVCNLNDSERNQLMEACGIVSEEENARKEVSSPEFYEVRSSRLRKRKRKRILADEDAAELGAVLSSDSEAVFQAASPSSTNQNKPARNRVQKKANYAEALASDWENMETDQDQEMKTINEPAPVDTVATAAGQQSEEPVTESAEVFAGNAQPGSSKSDFPKSSSQDLTRFTTDERLLAAQLLDFAAQRVTVPFMNKGAMLTWRLPSPSIEECLRGCSSVAIQPIQVSEQLQQPNKKPEKLTRDLANLAEFLKKHGHEFAEMKKKSMSLLDQVNKLAMSEKRLHPDRAWFKLKVDRHSSLPASTIEDLLNSMSSDNEETDSASPSTRVNLNGEHKIGPDENGLDDEPPQGEVSTSTHRDRDSARVQWENLLDGGKQKLPLAGKGKGRGKGSRGRRK